mgnify:FL=1|jgi:iron complex transport system ATP-binding protein
MLQLSIENLQVKYGSQVIIDHVSARFNGGNMTAVIGKNGVGKTTLIKAIAKLVRRGGTVRLYDEKRNYSSQDIAYVPQMGNAAARLTVFEMVLLGLVKDLRWKVGEDQIQAVTDVLTRLNLLALSKKPFHQLSGGQKQLIFMAQSLVSHPRVLLLDEPTNALDLRHQLIVMDQARSYTKETGAITIFVVHDLMLASRYGDNMILLDDTQIKTQGPPQEVLRPDLLESVYHVKVDVEKNGRGYFNVTPIAPI